MIIGAILADLATGARRGIAMYMANPITGVSVPGVNLTLSDTVLPPQPSNTKASESTSEQAISSEYRTTAVVSTGLVLSLLSPLAIRYGTLWHLRCSGSTTHDVGNYTDSLSYKA